MVSRNSERVCQPFQRQQIGSWHCSAYSLLHAETWAVFKMGEGTGKLGGGAVGKIVIDLNRVRTGGGMLSANRNGGLSRILEKRNSALFQVPLGVALVACLIVSFVLPLEEHRLR